MQTLINMFSKHKLGLILWLTAMSGVIPGAVLVTPLLLAGKSLPVSMSIVISVQIIQLALILALAVWSGVALGPRVKLYAPTFSGLLAGTPVSKTLKLQIFAGIAGGILGGILLLGFAAYTPKEMSALTSRFVLPLWLRILYGGITEEILVRWGLMSAILWLGWKIFQSEKKDPHGLNVSFAILISALIFGAAHLPAANAMLGGLTPAVTLYILAGNASFGIIAGVLFWRFGIEAAIIAHTAAHMILYFLN